MYVNPNNLDEELLPIKKYFDNILTMKKITKRQYKEVRILRILQEFSSVKG